MKISAAPYFPLLILVLLVGGSYWLERLSHLDESGNRGHLRHDPDFIIDNFTTRQFGLDGTLQHTLVARQMRHYPDTETSEVDTPSVTYLARQPITHLSAQRAWVSKDGKEIRLFGAVRVVREASQSQPVLTITSDELSVFPDEELARTNTPVTLTRGAGTLHGQALEADNKQQRYRLSGQVRGRFAPPSAQPPH